MMTPDSMMKAIDNRMEEVQKSYPELYKRWSAIRARFALYNTAQYGYFSHYLRSDAIKKRLYQIGSGLDVLAELEKTPKSEEKIKAVCIAIELEIDRIELKQKLRLSKDQKDKGRIDEDAEFDKINKRKHDLETSMRKQAFSKDYNQNPLMYRFFKYYELRTINYRKHLQRMDDVNEALRIPKGVMSLASTIVYVAARHVSQTVSYAFMAVPMFGAFVNAITLIRNAWNAWSKDKSTTTKAWTTGILVAACVGAVVTGIAPVTAPAIGCLMVGIGLVNTCVLPWLRARKNIQYVKDQIAINEKRVTKLSEKSLEDISDSEQKILLRLVENCSVKAANKGTPIASDLITEAKQKILATKHLESKHKKEEPHAKFVAIQNDPLIKAALEDYRRENNRDINFDIHCFLKEGIDQEQVALRNRLNKAEDSYIKKSVLLGNGAVSFVGAVLLCIPTPATWIAGGAILLATTVVQAAIKNDWLGKLKGLFKGTSAQKPAPVTSNQDNDITLQKSARPEFKKTAEMELEPVVTIDAPQHSIVMNHSTQSYLPQKNLVPNNKAVPNHEIEVKETPINRRKK